MPNAAGDGRFRDLASSLRIASLQHAEWVAEYLPVRKKETQSQRFDQLEGNLSTKYKLNTRLGLVAQTNTRIPQKYATTPQDYRVEIFSAAEP